MYFAPQYSYRVFLMYKCVHVIVDGHGLIVGILNYYLDFLESVVKNSSTME